MDHRDKKSMLKELKRIGGTEVAQTQTVIPLKGEQAETVKKTFLDLLNQRQIPGVVIKQMEGELDYTLIQKTILKNESAMMAVRIGSYGNDLILEMRHHESSQKHALGWLIITVVGVFFFWTGFGFVAMIVGFWMSRNMTLSGPEVEESQLLKEIVTETLFQALENCEISPTGGWDE